MAKVQNNDVVLGLSGSLGNLVFRQMPDGSTYVSKKHDFSRRKFSQGQKDHQSRFKQAVFHVFLEFGDELHTERLQKLFKEWLRHVTRSAINLPNRRLQSAGIGLQSSTLPV